MPVVNTITIYFLYSNLLSLDEDKYG